MITDILIVFGMTCLLGFSHSLAHILIMVTLWDCQAIAQVEKML